MAARIDEQQVAVAGVYARSLLTLANQVGEVDRIHGELNELRAAAETQADVRRFIADPLVDSELRRDSLERLFRGEASDLLVNTLQVMNRKGRLELVPALAEAYHRELEERRHRVEVYVITAVPLSEESRERLRSALTRYTGLEADLLETVDEGLIGGMVLRIGDSKFDTSVAKELRHLGDRLRDRASAEIQAGKAYFAEAEGAE